MPMSQQVIHKELSRKESQEYLDRFQQLEYHNRLSTMDWHGSDSANFYIWSIDITSGIEIPIGFIGYNFFALANGEEFIYIVKFFISREYRTYDNPNDVKLIEEEKASILLFREIISKGKNIITLTSASKKLDTYYSKKYGFVYDEEICEKLANIVGEPAEGFLYLALGTEKRDLQIENAPKNLFG